MAEEKSRSESRYGAKDKKPEKAPDRPAEGSPAEEKAEPAKEAMAEGDDMPTKHSKERKEMRGRHEKEHRDTHGQHRTAMRAMMDRHEADLVAMSNRHDTEAAGGGTVGTPEADADQMPNAGLSEGATV